MTFWSLGNKARPRFICELRVDGFNYTGVGNSISKKDASTNAARDFIEYLIRTAQINPSEVPEHVSILYCDNTGREV